MVITGLEHARYFLFNPIWVDVSEAETRIKVDVDIEGVVNSFEYYTFNNSVRFDIARLILGLIKNIKNKTSLIGTMDGGYKVLIKIEDYQSETSDQYEAIKYFLLGGKKGYETNVSAPTNLSLTNFAWNGYPNWKSTFFKSVQNTQQPNEMNWLRPKLNCNNIFIAFRNNLAGFSYYLFEDFEIEDSGKNKGYYFTQHEVKVSGVDVERSIIVRGKIKRDFYETIAQLADSFEIYVYNQNILDSDKQWVRVNGANNKVSFNPKNIATDVEMSFSLISNFNKVW